MKLKDKKNLHLKTLPELLTELATKQEELVNLRLELATNKLKDTSLVKKTKEHIAILKTIIHSKNL